MIRSRFARLTALAAAAVMALAPTLASAQSYPTTSPTYTPAAVLASQSLTTATTSSTFLVNNVSTVYLRVGGTFSALVATVQGTESRGTSPSWTAIPAALVGGSTRGLITATGLYKIDVAGLAGVRVNVTTLTGTNVTLAFSAGGPPSALPPAQGYRASVAALSTAASATDVLDIIGSATTTVRVNRISCSGVSTAIGAAPLSVVKRSTANTGGTSSAATIVPVDSGNNAATAVVTSYTANPTTGTLVGTVATGLLVTTPVATSTIPTGGVVFDFSSNPIVLRGVAQTLALNARGASLPGGIALDCTVDFSEQ